MDEILQIPALKGIGFFLVLRVLVPTAYVIWWTILHKRMSSQKELDGDFEILRICLTFINCAILFEIVWFIFKVIKFYL